MENGFNFMQNYLQMASFFKHGETFNQQESMIFDSLQVWQVVCEFSCWYISITYTLLAKFEFPAPIPNESRLNLFLCIHKTVVTFGNS